MKNNLFTPVIILLVSIVLSTCTKNESTLQDDGGISTNFITITANGNFSPATLRVPAGSSITFLNNDSKPHKIISTNNVIVTNVIAPKSSFVFINNTAAGIFPYYSSLNTAICGTIILTPL